eukprot:scaffold3773_cov26-Tisochrysis_lutea.AAC.2
MNATVAPSPPQGVRNSAAHVAAVFQDFFLFDRPTTAPNDVPPLIDPTLECIPGKRTPQMSGREL